MELDDSTPDVALPRPRSWWRRWLRRIAVTLLVAAAVGAVRYAWWRHGVHERLEAAVIELDAADPGWRLADIEAARADVPEDENTSRVVVAAAKLLPTGWPPREFSDTFANLSPPERLDPAAYDQLRKELDGVAPALAEARKLAGMPRGRHRIAWARNVYTTLLQDQQSVRAVAYLLTCDAMRCDQEGDVQKSLTACRATFHAGRSIGDEPLAISQLIRIATFAIAAGALERTLAQGEPPADDLADLQRLLEDEDTFPGLQLAVRGERASMHQLFSAMEAGDFTLSQIDGRKKSPWEERVFGMIYRDRIRNDHPQIFRWMGECLEVARLPPHLREEAAQRFDAGIRSAPRTIVTILFPALNKVEPADRQHHARVRSLAVALAAERYRREHNAWPESLDQLAPRFLAAVPLDPYDGAPLRYRRLADGVVVYSVGPDRTDDGGSVRSLVPTEPGADVGARLWDVAHRRQPPAERPPAEGVAP
jgi:hypothetical protein